MKRPMFRIALLLSLVFSAGCANLATIDRELLNHPAMDLQQSRTPAVSSRLTGLGNARQAAASGGCTTCAH